MEFDGRWAGAGLEQVGIDEVGYYAGIMEGCAFEAVAFLVVAAIALQEIGDGITKGVLAIAKVLQSFGGGDRGVGDIERDQGDGDVAGENHMGRMGIAVDVEFGGRGDIAVGDGSAHDHDLLDVLGNAGFFNQGEGEVGEWAEGGDRDRDRAV